MRYGTNYNVEYIDKEIGDNKYMFECEYVNSRDGFSHVCTLWHDGHAISTNRVHYLNRTWEAYRFQSVMLGCVRNAQELILDRAFEQYKEANGIKRLVGKRRMEVIEATQNSREYKEMELLYKMVSDAHYGTEAEREELESLDRLLKLTEAFATLMKKGA